MARQHRSRWLLSCREQARQEFFAKAGIDDFTKFSRRYDRKVLRVNGLIYNRDNVLHIIAHTPESIVLVSPARMGDDGIKKESP